MSVCKQLITNKQTKYQAPAAIFWSYSHLLANIHKGRISLCVCLYIYVYRGYTCSYIIHTSTTLYNRANCS